MPLPNYDTVGCKHFVLCCPPTNVQNRCLRMSQSFLNPVVVVALSQSSPLIVNASLLTCFIVLKFNLHWSYNVVLFNAVMSWLDTVVTLSFLLLVFLRFIVIPYDTIVLKCSCYFFSIIDYFYPNIDYLIDEIKRNSFVSRKKAKRFEFRVTSKQKRTEKEQLLLVLSCPRTYLRIVGFVSLPIRDRVIGVSCPIHGHFCAFLCMCIIVKLKVINN